MGNGSFKFGNVTKKLNFKFGYITKKLKMFFGYITKIIFLQRRILGYVL